MNAKDNVVEQEFNANHQGRFYIADGQEVIAQMQVGISGSTLTVYHTEVLPEAEGQGLAKKLLAAMVSYARSNALKVTPLCSYVQAQFKRNPPDYADIWTPNSKK